MKKLNRTVMIRETGDGWIVSFIGSIVYGPEKVYYKAATAADALRFIREEDCAVAEERRAAVVTTIEWCPATRVGRWVVTTLCGGTP